MFSRWHPGAILGWACGGWRLRHGVLSHLLIVLAICLVAFLLSAGRVLAHGDEAGREYGQPGAVLAISCHGVYHVVRAGETIYSIAGMYGTTAYRIRYCNGLASYRVYTGQILLVPIYRNP